MNAADSRPADPGIALTVDGLCVDFRLRTGMFRAVDAASFTLRRGRTLCLVGESGSGKSVTARSVMQIISPA